MSKVDTTFDFAAPLIAEWGQPAKLITKGDPIYDINTGETTEQEIEYDVKVVISSLDITEIGGLYQANDVKNPDRPSTNQLHLPNRSRLLPSPPAMENRTNT